MSSIRDNAPAELRVAVQEFFPDDQVDNAIAIAQLESDWNAFAVNDTTSSERPCGTLFDDDQGRRVSAERSVGYFQINSCNFPEWEWQRFYNARHNAGTAHLLWDNAGGKWTPWFFSAGLLGLPR